MQSLEQKKQQKASECHERKLAALPFLSLLLRRKKHHLPFHQYLTSVIGSYCEVGYKREATTGENTTSVLENAILLSVAMMLLSAETTPTHYYHDGRHELSGKQSSFLEENG